MQTPVPPYHAPLQEPPPPTLWLRRFQPCAPTVQALCFASTTILFQSDLQLEAQFDQGRSSRPESSPPCRLAFAFFFSSQISISPPMVLSEPKTDRHNRHPSSTETTPPQCPDASWEAAASWAAARDWPLRRRPLRLAPPARSLRGPRARFRSGHRQCRCRRREGAAA